MWKDWKEKLTVDTCSKVALQLLFGLICLCMGILIGQGEGNMLTPTTATATDADETTVRNWGLSFDKDGGCPRVEIGQEVLAKYDARYIGDTKENKVYLTFDCGYENGNTEAILDALKEHNVSATFFVVGHYLESAPELVKRMVEEGHTVANHTYHHPDMSSIKTQSAFQEELEQVNKAFFDLTGQEMVKYYRPPQGKYTLENLKQAKELGYQSFFWSLAYVDWNTDQQPDPQQSIEKLCSRIHPGAIVLLHNTSDTNGQIMGDLLTRWEEMGYQFGTLSELCGK